MSETYEKLGIEIEIIQGSSLKNTLDNIAKTLNKAVKVEGFQKLLDIFQKIEGVGTGNTIKSVSERIETLQRGFNLTEAEAKNLMKAIGDDNYFRKAITGFGQVGTELEKDALFARRLTTEIEKAHEAANKINNAPRIQATEQYFRDMTRSGMQPVNGGWVRSSVNIKQPIDDAYAEALKMAPQYDKMMAKAREWQEYMTGLRTQGKALWNGEIVSLKEYGDRLREANHYLEQGQSIMALYRNNGMQPVNGGWVRSSVDTRQNITDAHGEAVKMNRQYDDMLIKAREWEGYMQSLRTQGKAIWNGQVVSLQEYNRNLKAMNGELKEAAKGSHAWNLSLEWFSKRIVEFYSIRTVLFAIANQFRDAVGGALDFNQSMHDIAAISNASRTEMDMLGKSILNIATHSKFSAKEVADLMTILAQAGITAKDMPKISETVGMFATGSGATPEQAADVFTTAMNVWDVAAERGLDITNTLTAGLNNSKLSVQGLATAFNYLAPQAATFGYTLEETTGIIAAMSQAGVKASTIGTGVSQLLKELAAPKDRLKGLLDYYKIGMDDVNPRMRSFADIVDKFKEKGVAAEHIMQSLDTRVGRSLIAAMKVGGDEFRKMTESVTGTNAAFVAYEKSMEGARAKINVLKSEFLTAAVMIGGATGGVLSAMVDMFTNVVRGLQTTQGQFLILATGVAALTIGVIKLTAACIANPILGGITIGILAIGGALFLLGKDYDKLRNSIETNNKAMAESSSTLQRVKDVFTDAKIEAESRNKSLKEAGKLYETLSDKTKLSAEVLGTQVEITKKTKDALYELKKEYPDHFRNLDIEKMKYEQILDVLRDINAERGAVSVQAINQHNMLQTRMNSNQDEIAILKNYYGNQSPKAGEETVAYRRRLREGEAAFKRIKYLEEEIERDKKADSTNRQLADPRMYKIEDNDWWTFQEADRVDPLKKGKPPLPKKNNKAQAEAEKAAKNDTTFKYWLEEQGHRAAIEEVKLDKDEQERILKDKTKNFEDRQEALTKIYKLNYALFYEERAKKIEELNKVFAEKNGMLFDAEDGVYRNPKKIGGDGKGEVISIEDPLWKKAVDNGNVGRRDMQSVMETIGMFRKTNAADKKADSELKLSDKETLRSDYLEKQADRKLRLETQALDIEKQYATTAEEVAAIEVRRVEAEIAANEMKKKAYQDDIVKLTSIIEKSEVHDSVWQDAVKQLALYKEKHEDVNILLGVERRKLDELKDNGFWSNFKAGSDQAIVALGTMKANTQALGNTITTSFYGGMTNGISGMLQALARGRGAWASFKEAMSNILQSMSKAFSDYIAMMIVELLKLYVIQKLVGLAGSMFGGAASSGNAAAGANYWGTPSGNGVTVNIGTGGLITPSGVQRYDVGGLVPFHLGERGRDSVPALLMPGEYVVREDAVKFFGVDFFRKINAKRMAEGGLVGGSAPTRSQSSTPADGNGEVTLNIINVVDPRSIPKTTGAEILNVINYEVAKEGPTYKQLKAKIVGK